MWTSQWISQKLWLRSCWGHAGLYFLWQSRNWKGLFWHDGLVGDLFYSVWFKLACRKQAGWTRWPPEVSSNLNYSIILQFRFLYSLHYHSFIFNISFLLLVPHVCIFRPCRDNLTCTNGVTFLRFKDPKDLFKANKGDSSHWSGATPFDLCLLPIFAYYIHLVTNTLADGNCISHEM